MSSKFASRMARPRAVAAMLVSAMVVLGAAQTAPAQTGDFTCRASALRLQAGSLVLEPVASNRLNDPCVSDSDGPAPLTVANTLGARLLQSSTTSTPTGATSRASVADVDLLLMPGVAVDVAGSEVRVSCSAAGTPVFSGSSQVVGVRIGGASRAVFGTPNQRINLPLGLGFIVLNQEIVTADRITRRAVFVSTPLLTLAVAESIAGVHGNPCAPPPPHRPQCSDGIDNDGDGSIDHEATDPRPLHPDRQCTSPTDDDEST